VGKHPGIYQNSIRDTSDQLSWLLSWACTSIKRRLENWISNLGRSRPIIKTIRSSGNFRMRLDSHSVFKKNCKSHSKSCPSPIRSKADIWWVQSYSRLLFTF